MQNKLNTLVDNLIKEHVGGQQFFTALDENLRKDSLFKSIVVYDGSKERDPNVTSLYRYHP